MRRLSFLPLLLILAWPTLAAAQSPLGFAVRVGPVWSETVLEDKGYHRDRTEWQSEFAATFAPSLRFTDNVSLIGSVTHLFDAEAQEYALQMEYRWPACAEVRFERARERPPERVKRGARSRYDPCQECRAKRQR